MEAGLSGFPVLRYFRVFGPSGRRPDPAGACWRAGRWWPGLLLEPCRGGVSWTGYRCASGLVSAG